MNKLCREGGIHYLKDPERPSYISKSEYLKILQKFLLQKYILSP